jgi:hypothetical protein
MVMRRARSDGAVELEESGVRIVVARRRGGVVLVEIHGEDRDQLGAAPFVELDGELARHAPLALFFDVAGTSGATTPVREAWTAWLARHRASLREVHVLAPERFVRNAIDVARHFSRTGDLIRIDTDRVAFERALEDASRRRA